MDGDDNEVRRRRIRPRRAAGGFSSSGVADSSEGGGVRDINEAVRAEAERPPVSLPPNPEHQLPEELRGTASPQEEYNPGTRLAQVRRRSSEYEREYRLTLLHRLLMRRIPLDEIAQQLQVSVSQVMRDRKELHARLREVSKELDIDLIVGNSTNFYEEAAAMAMRAASNAQAPLPMRLAAIRTGIAAENDKHRFYQAAGVYDVLRYRRAAGKGAQTDIQRMLELTERLIEDATPGQRDNPLGEFSGGDSEVMDL